MSRTAWIALTAVVAAWSGCDETPLPADVRQVIVDKCHQCHGSTTQFGAPMSLLSWDDTQEPAPTNPSIRVWQQMQRRIDDAQTPMPPRGVPALTDAEREVLEAWFAAGAPPATD